jgi:hypothetical protein
MLFGKQPGDPNRRLERSQSILAAHDGRAAGPNAAKERANLLAQRVGLFEAALVDLHG